MTITTGWFVFLLGGVTALGKHVDNQEGVREANSHILIEQLSNLLKMGNNDHVGDAVGDLSGNFRVC